MTASEYFTTSIKFRRVTRWLSARQLSPTARLLYRTLLDIASSARRDDFHVSDAELVSYLGTTRSAFYDAKRQLCRGQFVEYDRESKLYRVLSPSDWIVKRTPETSAVLSCDSSPVPPPEKKLTADSVQLARVNANAKAEEEEEGGGQAPTYTTVDNAADGRDDTDKCSKVNFDDMDEFLKMFG